MGSVTIANALAFTPNLRKGITAGVRVMRLINRKPKVTDAPDAKEKLWVKLIDQTVKLKVFLYFRFRVLLMWNTLKSSLLIRQDQRKRY